MAFDLSTARPVDEPKSGGFDLSTARPVEIPADEGPTAWQETKAVAGDLGEHAMNVLGELAAAANRSVVDFVDFIGPDTANAILRLSGSDKQMPTLRGAMADTGIEGGFMAPGTARDAVQGAGNAVGVAAGMVPVARGAGKAGSAALPSVASSGEDTLTAGSGCAGDDESGGQFSAPRSRFQTRRPKMAASQTASAVRLPTKGWAA